MSEREPSKEAQEFARRVIEIDELHGERRLMIGGTYLYIGVSLPPLSDPEQAAEYYRRLIAIDFDAFAARVVKAERNRLFMVLFDKAPRREDGMRYVTQAAAFDLFIGSDE
jgi:hypothetical protein